MQRRLRGHPAASASSSSVRTRPSGTLCISRRAFRWTHLANTLGQQGHVTLKTRKQVDKRRLSGHNSQSVKAAATLSSLNGQERCSSDCSDESQRARVTRPAMCSNQDAAANARRHLRRKAVEFDEADRDGDQEVDAEEFARFILPRVDCARAGRLAPACTVCEAKVGA